MKNGLLLINLGTTDRPKPSAARRYLAEFLVDKRVITLPAPLRYLLMNVSYFATLLAHLNRPRMKPVIGHNVSERLSYWPIN